MGNIGSQLGEALGGGIQNAISAYQQVQELNRRRRLEDEQAADRATQRAEHRLGILQGEARNQFLSQNYDAVASGIPGMNEQRKALGLGELPGMKPTAIKAPDLGAVGPFDASRGAPRPLKQIGEQWTPEQVRSLRGIAGVAPHYANASGDIWDETTGQYVTTLPMTGIREKIASQEAISANRQAAADARAAEANNIRMFLGGLAHMDRQAALRSQNDRFQQGQGNLGGRMKWLAPDGKTYWVGVSKEGKYLPIPGPDGKPMQAPPDAASAGDGLLDDAPDAPAAPPTSGGGWFSGWFGGGSSNAPKPSPSMPPPGAPVKGAALVGPKRSATMEQWRPAVREAAARHGVSEDLVMRIMQQESGGNPNAHSPAGAHGLMQLMPGTAKYLKVNPNDPRQNIEGGAKYLAELLRQFGGDEEKARAAYNAGPGAVQKYGGVPPYPETQGYVRATAPPPRQKAKPIKPQASGPRADLNAQRKAGQELADLILSEMGE